MSRIVQPSVKETAFNCPHCFTFTSQSWYSLYAKQVDNDERLPVLPDGKKRAVIENAPQLTPTEKANLLGFLRQLTSGFVVLNETRDSTYTQSVWNLHLSECYNCKKLSVWVRDRLLFPATKPGLPPNPDLPDDIIHDFEEALEIVNASPRGAASLLRLCIQKLCIHLGEKGKSIDDDIASLVVKGLNPLVQQSLDIVRVIGNEAVHPGVMDLKDDRDTAMRLFELVNSIADQMITHPKAVKEMYSKLPEAKRKGIENRDKK